MGTLGDGKRFGIWEEPESWSGLRAREGGRGGGSAVNAGWHATDLKYQSRVVVAAAPGVGRPTARWAVSVQGRSRFNRKGRGGVEEEEAAAVRREQSGLDGVCAASQPKKLRHEPETKAEGRDGSTNARSRSFGSAG